MPKKVETPVLENQIVENVPVIQPKRTRKMTPELLEKLKHAREMALKAKKEGKQINDEHKEIKETFGQKVNDIETFKKIKEKRNVLIIMDEIQIASKYKQTIYKTFLKGLFLNGDTLYENDIKILEFTATPDGTLYDLNLWKNGAKKIISQPLNSYISSFSIYKMKMMKQYENL
jgi:hypothetical protein